MFFLFVFFLSLHCASDWEREYEWELYFWSVPPSLRSHSFISLLLPFARFFYVLILCARLPNPDIYIYMHFRRRLFLLLLLLLLFKSQRIKKKRRKNLWWVMSGTIILAFSCNNSKKWVEEKRKKIMKRRREWRWEQETIIVLVRRSFKWTIWNEH